MTETPADKLLTGSHPPRILIVEDESALADLIRDAVGNKLHCRMNVVSSIREARRLLATEPFEVMVTDIRLPDGDGMSLVKSMRRNQPLSSSIVMTGSPTVETAVTALRWGAVDFLAKPFSMDTLLDGVRKAILRQSVVAREDRRFERLREAVKRLNAARRQVSRKVDLLCNDLVGAYGDLAKQLDIVRTTESFRSSCQTAVDLEQLLCHAMDWMLRQLGYSNLAIWLAADDDFHLGAYMKYSIPGEPTLTDAMKHGLVSVANRRGLVRADGEALGHLLSDAERPLLADQSVLGCSCTYLGETIATMILFRDARQPFTEEQESVVRAISPVFSLALATIVRGPPHPNDDDFDGPFGDHDQDREPPAGGNRDEGDWWKNGQPPPF
jgi:FixJ family two-component response regulator